MTQFYRLSQLKLKCFRNHWMLIFQFMLFCVFPFLWRRLFKRWKRFFFSKHSVSTSYFLNFLTSKVFWFSTKKTSQIRWKEIFMKYYHLIRILQKICLNFLIWKKLKALFLKKKSSIVVDLYCSQMLNFLRNFSLSGTFYSKIATIWWKKSRLGTCTQMDFSVNAIGRHRVKNVLFERNILLPIL